MQAKITFKTIQMDLGLTQSRATRTLNMDDMEIKGLG